MAQGNRGFADRLANTGAATQPAARLPPRTGLLDGRENRLAEMAAGTAVTRIHELIDPVRCRMWEGHNREYAALDADNCADLIESMRAQGKQEVPAIVRRVAGDPQIAFEVICGARRHWTVSWLRTHDYPDFKFLVEARELTDEEAFRLADLENRNRRDLSDYERATDYARAVERYYAGNQQRMVERLEVTKSWLSRYLELARLPAELLSAFGTPHAIGISHAAVLAPLLRVAVKRERVLLEAGVLTAEQHQLAEKKAALVRPAIVVKRLAAAADATAPRRTKPKEHVVRSGDGGVVARGQRGGRGGGVAIIIPAPGVHSRQVVLDAVSQILEQIAPPSGG
jgi:ParB family transcriptional regulator, chromosome partitioning protein